MPLLCAAAQGGRPPALQAALFGVGLPIAFAPFVSFTGDYYEMGSILVSRLTAWLTPGFPVTRWRSDDLFKLIDHLFTDPGGGTAGDALGLLVSFAVGVVLAFLTYAAGHGVARALGAGGDVGGAHTG